MINYLNERKSFLAKNRINALNLLSFFSFAIFDGNFIENLINFPDTHRHIFVTTILENIICNFSKITSFLCSSIFLYTKIQSKSKINVEISQKKANPNIFHTISFHRHFLSKYLKLRLNACQVYFLSNRRQYVLDRIVVIKVVELDRMNLAESQAMHR